MSHLSDRPENAVVGVTVEHESAALHVTGHALYTDDLVRRSQHVLHAHPVQAPHAHARITRLDPSKAYDVPGVVRVLTQQDVPGVNDAGIKHDEPLFPDEVRYHGHAVCWVLGETLEAARRGALERRGRVRAAARDPDGGRGDRGRELPGHAAGAGPRRRRRRTRQGGPRLRGRDRLRGAGALLPRDALCAGDGRRERPGVRAVQHPAPDRDPGDHRPRPRPAQQPGHRAVPADGRRFRRQGDAAARARRGRRVGRHPHRPSGPAAPDPPAGHDDDRQAARLPRHLARRLRRRRPLHRARGDADLRRRVEPRPLRTRPLARPVPRRQRLLHPGHPRAGPDRPDQQDLADGLPRFRRPAGDARDRGHHRSLRAPARDRARRPAPPQLLRRGREHAVRPARPPPRTHDARLGPGPRHERVRRPSPRDRRPSTTSTRTPSGAWRSRR